MALHRKKRHKDRLWSWREGARIRALKAKGMSDSLARAIAKAEFDKRKLIAAIFGSKIERSAELAISSAPNEAIRFHLVIPDELLDDQDRKSIGQLSQPSLVH